MKEQEIVNLPYDSFMDNEIVHFVMPHMTLHFTIEEFYMFFDNVMEVGEAVEMVMNKDEMAKS
ncbi:hypothetical protein H8D04_01065 [bacterium]|nr:hypothetical protein [bacterium]